MGEDCLIVNMLEYINTGKFEILYCAIYQYAVSFSASCF